MALTLCNKKADFQDWLFPLHSSPNMQVGQNGETHENCLRIQKQPSVLIAVLKISLRLQCYLQLFRTATL